MVFIQIAISDHTTSPPKLKTIRILDNPFDDIVPRITAEEKRAQQRARENAQRERELEAKRSKKRWNHNLISDAGLSDFSSNPKLLSFGMDEEDTGDAISTVKKKDIARPDCKFRR
jgi:peptidyl-prolyl cis-trans isomerase SDCCAG10